MIQRLAILWVLLGGSVLAAEFTRADRDWWAFQPVRQSAVPDAGGDWAINNIDHFIARRLAAQELSPATTADRRTLIRRVCLDLTGLPPAPEQIAAFLDDDSPDAYEKLVDRLLDSPRYGESQATFWLDLVRYADSDGYKSDHYRPEAWRYRDYVIRSFNTDKPYDRFVREQLAGDEIDPGNRDALIATMFLRHWIYEYNQRDVETQWNEILADVTNVTGDVFLGMGLQCARCHDHKFDPIPQRDYYRMRAFFTPLLPRDSMPVGTVSQRFEFFEQHKAWAAATDDIRRQLHAIELPALLKNTTGEGFSKFIDRIKTMVRKRPEDRTGYERQIAELSERQFGVEPEKLPERLKGGMKEEWERLRAELKSFEAQKPKPLPQVKFVISDAGPVAPATRIPKKGDDVEPGFLSILNPGSARITLPPAALRSTGRRTALAKWITSPDNPLTSRVMVNRLWQQHFGRGLAANTSDFGKLGEPPTHPGLLDYLASQIMDRGWSAKDLIRQVVLSRTYRQSSKPNFASAKVDPNNNLLHRMPIRRLQAEAIRDQLLVISGRIDRQQFGRGPKVHITPFMRSNRSPSGSGPMDGAGRRSIYVEVRRNHLESMLMAFDKPTPFTTMGRRTVSNSPAQPLIMLNNEFVHQQAALWADTLLKTTNANAAELVSLAYRQAFGREPEPWESGVAVEFLEQQQKAAGGESLKQPLADLCHTLFNVKEFVFIN